MDTARTVKTIARIRLSKSDWLNTGHCVPNMQYSADDDRVASKVSYMLQVQIQQTIARMPKNAAASLIALMMCHRQ